MTALLLARDLWINFLVSFWYRFGGGTTLWKTFGELTCWLLQKASCTSPTKWLQTKNKSKHNAPAPVPMKLQLRLWCIMVFRYRFFVSPLSFYMVWCNPAFGMITSNILSSTQILTKPHIQHPSPWRLGLLHLRWPRNENRITLSEMQYVTNLNR